MTDRSTYAHHESVPGTSSMNGSEIHAPMGLRPQPSVIESSPILSVLVNAPDISILTDTSGRVQYVNPAFEEWTGYPLESVIGQRVDNLSHHEHTDRRRSGVTDAIAGAQAWRGQLGIATADGGELQIECALSPVSEENGDLLGFLVIGRDAMIEMELRREIRRTGEMGRQRR